MCFNPAEAGEWFSRTIGFAFIDLMISFNPAEAGEWFSSVHFLTYFSHLQQFQSSRSRRMVQQKRNEKYYSKSFIRFNPAEAGEWFSSGTCQTRFAKQKPCFNPAEAGEWFSSKVIFQNKPYVLLRVSIQPKPENGLVVIYPKL